MVLLGSSLFWSAPFPRLSSLPPARVTGERLGAPGLLVLPFISFPLNNTINLPLILPEIPFFPRSCLWPRYTLNRHGGSTDMSWPIPELKYCGEEVRLPPKSWDAGLFSPDLGGDCCTVESAGSWGSLTVRSLPSPLCAVHLSPCISSLVVSSKDGGVLGSCPQSSMEYRKVGVLFDGCYVVVYKLQDVSFLVVATLYNLKLVVRGDRCVKSECYLCILKSGVVDLDKDGDSCSFGSIHRWQVREPPLLIPRYIEQECFRLTAQPSTPSRASARSIARRVAGSTAG